MRGLAQLDEPLVLKAEPRSGLPVLSLGRVITSDEVAVLLDEQ